MSFLPPTEPPEDSVDDAETIKSSYDALSEAAVRQLVTQTLDRRLRKATSMIILVEAVSAAWADALRRQFAQTYPELRIRTYKASGKAASLFATEEDPLLVSLQLGQTVIAVSTDLMAFVPPVLRHAADHTLHFAGLSRSSLADAIGAATGTSIDLPIGVDVPELDLPELAATIRPSSSPNECLVRMRRAANRKSDDAISTSSVPPTTALPLTAPVRAWSDKMLISLKQLERGEISMQQSPFTLLGGPPGTGKTLLAESIARAAGWRFVATSAEEWFSKSDGYLGGVTKQMAQFFSTLREHPKTIGLIDELEAVPDRATLDGKNRDWWTTVVTGFLRHIDKLRRSSSTVVVLGASNYPERIDAALLRPGRISGFLRVDAPRSAEEIGAFFRFGLGEDFDGKAISHLVELALSFGLPTPAQIMDWCGAAKAKALSAERPLVVRDVEHVMIGEDHRSLTEKQRVAVHEAGHAVIAAVLGVSLQSVTILPQGNSSGSVQAKLRTVDLDRNRVESIVTVALAGRATDKLIFGNVDATASSDLLLATNLLVDAHHKWGLFGQLLVFDIDGTSVHQLNPDTRSELEGMLQTLMARAESLVRLHRTSILALAADLLELRTLAGETLEKRLADLNLPMVKPEQEAGS